MDIKYIYNKYVNYIVILLFILLMFKNCQSCNRAQTINYNKQIYNQEIQHAKNTNDSLVLCIDSLRNVINEQCMEINSLNTLMDKYILDNNHYRNTNRILINANHKLINKETENK